MNPKAFGRNLTRLHKRNRPDLTQTELAAKADLRQEQVSRMKKGVLGLPETPTLLRLASALECDVNELLGGVHAYYDHILRRIRRRRRVADYSPPATHGLQGEVVINGDAPTPSTHVSGSTTSGDADAQLITVFEQAIGVLRARTGHAGGQATQAGGARARRRRRR